jgi:hypothetical protein
MTGKFKRSAAALALAVSFSMAATPALARGGWGGHYHKRDRVDGGDILAGILIIGGIAAIASAASKAKKEREQMPRDYPDDSYREDRNDYGRGDDRPEWREGSGIDMAVNRCIDEVNRGRERVGEVESVNRDANGWRVSGTTTGRGNFSCTIDRDGRIRNVNVDGQAI